MAKGVNKKASLISSKAFRNLKFVILDNNAILPQIAEDAFMALV